MSVISILKKEHPYLLKEYGAKKLAVFGSFAKGKQNKHSDVDIIIEFNKPVGFKFIELSEYLEKALHRKVDIITEEGLKSIRNPEISSEIRRHAKYV
ncbi:MAG: nucleotidyltransferase family protein [Victivallales bacterium]|jgi:hypothetical protein